MSLQTKEQNERKGEAVKVVIVGGVAGGATAAARLRRLDEQAEIVMVERTGYVSYANCGLPYYVGDVITDKRKLTLQSPKSFRERFDIDVRVRQEVIGINRAAKTVLVRNLEDGLEYKESYDSLILSPGAKAVKPDLPGIDDRRDVYKRQPCSKPNPIVAAVIKMSMRPFGLSRRSATSTSYKAAMRPQQTKSCKKQLE